MTNCEGSREKKHKERVKEWQLTTEVRECLIKIDKNETNTIGVL